MNSDRARRASLTLKRFTTWINFCRRRYCYQMVLIPIKKLNVMHPPIPIPCFLPGKAPDSTLGSALRTSLTTHTKLYTFRFRQEYSPRPTLLFPVGVDVGVDFAVGWNEGTTTISLVCSTHRSDSRPGTIQTKVIGFALISIY